MADRVFIADQKLDDLKDKNLSTQDRQVLEARLKKIRGLLVNQRQAGDTFLQSTYTLLTRMQQLQEIVEETRKRLENQYSTKIESSLLDREAPIFRQFDAVVITHELDYIRGRITSVFSSVLWQQLWLNFRRSAGPAPILFISLFTLMVVFHRRIHDNLKAFEDQLALPHWQHRRLAIRLLRRSFLLISAVLLILLYEWLDIPYINVSLAHVFFFGAMTLLIACWAIDFIANEFEEAVATWQVYVRGHLIHLVRTLRIVGLGLLLLLWVTGIEGFLGSLAVALIEAGLLVWLILFWRGFKGALFEGHRKGEMPPRKANMLAFKLLSYLVIAGSFLMDMVGYPGFAVYWMTAWFETIVFLACPDFVSESLDASVRRLHQPAGNLLDIAATTPQILKYPEPEVLFMDHGDSALVFRLRFWTPVQKSFLTPTDVRFELDRRFRELDIEIAFPQRDLHIRSLPEELKTPDPSDPKG